MTQRGAFESLGVPALIWASLLLAQAAAAWAAAAATGDATKPGPERVLWSRQPAQNWLEAMPLGNGLLGSTVFGGIERERIALNECTFWSGRPHDDDNPEAIKYFPQIRDLVFAGKFQEAEKMADEDFRDRLESALTRLPPYRINRLVDPQARRDGSLERRARFH
jgi:hypothetical protein